MARSVLLLLLHHVVLDRGALKVYLRPDVLTTTFAAPRAVRTFAAAAASVDVWLVVLTAFSLFFLLL
jgi:hypothetical protein